MLDRLKNHKNFILFLALCSFVLFFRLNDYAVVESSEARYAEISRAMYMSGDYIHPNLMGIQHYHKPPLTYQITALSYKLFGINPFAVRFFLQIAFLIQLLLVYKITLLLTKEKRTALWAAIIYFSFPIVIISIRNLTTDAFLNTFALLAIYYWIIYKSSTKIKYLYAFTVSLALGFLTKGPVILIMPFIFVLLYNRFVHVKLKFSFHHLMAWLLFFAIGFSWYIYLYIEDPIFLDYFVGNQTVDRFAKNDFGRTEPFWYFLVAVPILGLPWLFFIVYKWFKDIKLINSKSIEFLLSFSVLTPLIFFSLSSSKRILYILPFYGFFAVLAAIYLKKTTVTKTLKGIVYAFPLLILLSLSISPFLDLGISISKTLSLIGVTGLVLFVFVVFHKKLDSKTKLILTPFIGMFFMMLSFTTLSCNNRLIENPTQKITEFIQKEKLENRTTFVYNRFKPSISFNLNKPIISLNNGYKSLNRDRDTRFEKDTLWKNRFLDLRDATELNYFKQLSEEPSVLILLTKAAEEDSLSWLLKPYSKVKKFKKWQIYY